MINILLIEDNHDYAKYFSEYMLEKEINVNHIDQLNIEKINNEIMKNPDLIILDFFFDNENSLNVYSYLKKKNIPIMYLTSNDDIKVEENLLKQGVEDYIDKIKPLSIIEVKIRKMIKTVKIEYQFYGNTLNIETKKINNNCKLTENEYKILMCLIKNIGNNVLAEEIMIELWNDNIFIEKNTLVVAIKRMREKLRKYELNVAIDTKKGEGYKLNEIT